MIEFTVHGEPKAQPRPRAFARTFMVNGRQVSSARVYDAKTSEGWKSEIALAVRPFIPKTPIAGAVAIEVDFIFERPKSHWGKRGVRPSAPTHHVSKPDLDNLIKAVKDCLTVLRVWGDDSQVIAENLTKMYGDRPGARVKIVEVA
jgi:Holliday junction resolvase RusA-like endonuclease